MDDYEPKHLAYLLERLTRRSREDIWESSQRLGHFGRYDELTPAYFRLLSLMPDRPARVTDLARLSGMTKQALGQFVAMLEGHGYVESSADPLDRRVRMVQRTPRGDEVVATTHELWSRVERAWRRKIGAERYGVFRDVLIELATGWDPDELSAEK